MLLIDQSDWVVGCVVEVREQELTCYIYDTEETICVGRQDAVKVQAGYRLI
jgi:hypothetical protein